MFLKVTADRRQPGHPDCHMGVWNQKIRRNLTGTTASMSVLHLIVLKEGLLAGDLLGLQRA